jgi:hypothetical protein
MNNINIHTSDLRDADAVQARFALRITSGLSELSAPLPYDIEQRLRFGREQALGVARARLAAAGPLVVGATGGGLTLGAGGPSWWVRLASVLPLVVLIGGLLLIERGALEERIEAAAEIDTALLSDDLPPTAYADPGFVAFLKTSQN